MELRITEDSSWSRFDAVAHDFSSAFGVAAAAVCDGLDEAYYDYEIEGVTVTLHLQHYLGISIFVSKDSESHPRSQSVFGKISEYYGRKNEPNHQSHRTS
jgi:hypothetical protein